MQQSELKAEGVRWDLGGLYAGPDDPRLEADLAAARQRAEVFAQTYRGRIENGQVDGTALALALAEYEAIAELRHRPAFYASLLFAADTQNQSAQQLVQHTREAATGIENLLVFFSLELIALPDEQLAQLLTTSRSYKTINTIWRRSDALSRIP